MPISEQLLEILVCPACKKPLVQKENGESLKAFAHGVPPEDCGTAAFSFHGILTVCLRQWRSLVFSRERTCRRYS